jgi:hypothetical protein
MLLNKFFQTSMIAGLVCILASSCSTTNVTSRELLISETIALSRRYDYQGPKLVAEPCILDIEDQDSNDKLFSYRFKLEGMPLEPNQKFNFSISTLIMTDTLAADVILNDELRLVVDGHGDKVVLSLNGYMSAEYCDAVLMRKDGKSAATCRIIPQPIEACVGTKRISAELTSIDGFKYNIYGKGFKAKEKISIISLSSEERIESELLADSNGSFVTMLFPAVVGVKSGTCQVKFKDSNNEIFEITLLYGELLSKTKLRE